ncbi:hypothetical protein PIB30_057788 [Stylosanthes scabra]|uniref:Uncharacterized protein n=1 Tax=Stylosanthes scabra TaxID=79078 RepID=A0ABU6UJ91_9FABA|nr:hypothetical protein [Stylosanthes scabra]
MNLAGSALRLRSPVADVRGGMLAGVARVLLRVLIRTYEDEVGDGDGGDYAAEDGGRTGDESSPSVFPTPSSFPFSLSSIFLLPFTSNLFPPSPSHSIFFSASASELPTTAKELSSKAMTGPTLVVPWKGGGAQGSEAAETEYSRTTTAAALSSPTINVARFSSSINDDDCETLMKTREVYMVARRCVAAASLHQPSPAASSV